MALQSKEATEFRYGGASFLLFATFLVTTRTPSRPLPWQPVLRPWWLEVKVKLLIVDDAYAAQTNVVLQPDSIMEYTDLRAEDFKN